MSDSVYAITFTAREQAELLSSLEQIVEPGAEEIAHPTLVTLVSPGTELNGAYLGQTFPRYPGYAAIFAVERVGAAVGDLRFCMGKHRSYQCSPVSDTVAVPAGLAPEQAVFTRHLLASVGAPMVALAGIKEFVDIYLHGILCE